MCICFLHYSRSYDKKKNLSDIKFQYHPTHFSSQFYLRSIDVIDLVVSFLVQKDHLLCLFPFRSSVTGSVPPRSQSLPLTVSSVFYRRVPYPVCHLQTRHPLSTSIPWVLNFPSMDSVVLIVRTTPNQGVVQSRVNVLLPSTFDSDPFVQILEFSIIRSLPCLFSVSPQFCMYLQKIFNGTGVDSETSQKNQMDTSKVINYILDKY